MRTLTPSFTAALRVVWRTSRCSVDQATLMPVPLILSSPLLTGLQVPHGFTTRVGGVSPPPFDSLNFGNPGDLPPDRRDPAANIARNFDLVLSALGVSNPSRAASQVHQVHASDVHVIDRDGPGPTNDASPAPDPKADAIVTNDPSRLIAVRVADCCPILLSTGDGRAVAAVHAGWRGAVGGVVCNAARVLIERYSASAESLVAAIGPCIGPEAFEVGPEVVDEFRRMLPPRSHAGCIRPGAGDRATIDLQEAIRVQLEELGLVPQRIDVLRRCTVNDRQPDGTPTFFSHRRDRGLTGRMIGLIGPAR